MDTFHHFDGTSKSQTKLESPSEFIFEINQIVAFMNRSNFIDLVNFCSKDFKSMKKYTLSEKNLKFLDDLGKFCSHDLREADSNCSQSRIGRPVQNRT